VTRPVLAAGELVLRPPVDGDVAPLVEVLTDPEVATWWGRWDAARVHADLLAGGNGWVVERGGSVVGWLEVNVESEPDYEHVGLDIAIGAAGRGCGLGRQALRLVVRHFRDQGCHRFTIDPPPTTAGRCTPTPRWASARSGSCAPTSAGPTGAGTTTC